MDTLAQLVEHAREQARQRQELPPPRRRRAIRESAGIPQTGLARALDVDPATVCRWESGAREPRGAHLARYLDALDQLAREARA